MNVSPLDIPEILELLSKQLQQSDRARCLLVSKAFYSAILPDVWHTIVFQEELLTRRPLPFPPIITLQGHNHHVRELHFQGVFPKEHGDVGSYCPRLRVLRCATRYGGGSIDSNDTVRNGFTSLIALHASCLQELTLHIMQKTSSWAPELWTYIDGCSQLQSLDILGARIQPQSAHAFLNVCSRLRSLRMTGVYLPTAITPLLKIRAEKNKQLELDCQDQKNNHAGDGKMQRGIFAGLRNLELIGCLEKDDFADLRSTSGQALIVRNSPHLESLRWGWENVKSYLFIRDGLAASFIQAVHGDPWTLPRLESLDFTNTNIDDEDLAKILNQMSRLKSLRAYGTGFGLLSLQALLADRLFVPGVDLEAGPEVARPRRLCKSIETLHLEECQGLTSVMTQRLLASCPKLTSFSAGVLTVKDIARGQRWACLGLTELIIIIQANDALGVHQNVQLAGNIIEQGVTQFFLGQDQSQVLGNEHGLMYLPGQAQEHVQGLAQGQGQGQEEGHGSGHGDESDEFDFVLFQKMQRLVFARLSTLTKLKKLYLTGRRYNPGTKKTLDLRLSAGLSCLSKLRDIREVSFWSEVPQKMDAEEALWIEYSWPKIECLFGKWNEDDSVVELMKSILPRVKSRESWRQ